ncbi:methylthioribose-1-phosphate isomerase [Marinitoga sp. 1135]|uniref:Methylthioribose-1-phosphate isomerase n=1 Tax=Marinitoga piezophila (strain DSM 14283 / JCM 11233 / KA3) TaxID=443254 RepID=H2J4Y3_MARPK|nr:MULTISPECIES: S-methyl-5-thioribose-1-phosphate isomerase [Marinitoga]AEX86000.1 S-methyl-5-thioribose-1-phosphate isomerase [Marinitoga piezophila KA3]APT76422.1 methylthioribose-1-phosphate isomerase [Marinitoga sp. 1137]NUU96190.1 methylthioribose-1-phosphate isomerase [Marinitoga sp. 1135]NUU98098.1 methylthioribose-1-phosphate isomerase [Marinitoga sp. 1138]
MSKLKTMSMEWTGEEFILIDQRYLPLEEKYVTCKTYEEVAKSIKDMVVRGAPAIGASAAFGYVLGVKEFIGKPEFEEKMKEVKKTLANTRPTAVNLFWALERMEKRLNEIKNEENIVELIEKEALDIAFEDIEANKTMGRFGGELLNDGDTVLTHCNTGSLATVDYGTALGVIRGARDMGKDIKVYADETRPYLQGARLTVWELYKDGFDVTLISDNMAGWVMKQGKINAVIVGADRIAANGDTANKIGTYSVAVLAKEHGIPFYVAAPLSTIDLDTPTGNEIPIEERSHDEVRYCHKSKMVPEEIKVYNPAFDVTPNELITAIITEKGVVRPPYNENLKKLFEK